MTSIQWYARKVLFVKVQQLQYTEFSTNKITAIRLSAHRNGFLQIWTMWMSGLRNSGSWLFVGISSQLKFCCSTLKDKTTSQWVTEEQVTSSYMENICSHSNLKKLLLHFWVDAFSSLFIAANDAGLWSWKQLQALHQWNNRLYGNMENTITLFVFTSDHDNNAVVQTLLRNWLQENTCS